MGPFPVREVSELRRTDPAQEDVHEGRRTLGGNVMRLATRTMAVVGVLTVGGLIVATRLAHAGGCCGGGSRYVRGGGLGAGHTFARATYATGSACCYTSGMSMAGTNM